MTVRPVSVRQTAWAPSSASELASPRRFPVAGYQLDQRPHAEAARALRRVGVVLLAAGGAGDVEVGPRHVGHELLEEQAGGQRPAVTVAADVLDVGDLGVDVLAVLV